MTSQPTDGSASSKAHPKPSRQWSRSSMLYLRVQVRGKTPGTGHVRLRRPSWRRRAGRAYGWVVRWQPYASSSIRVSSGMYKSSGRVAALAVHRKPKFQVSQRRRKMPAAVVKSSFWGACLHRRQRKLNTFEPFSRPWFLVLLISVLSPVCVAFSGSLMPEL
ncbi:hypothetical protein N656DRAFT_597833 [Canariomyces notabilis]|uniref:Transmembrane protein n=1 Tax=Canariomyces notabilis TaxID=2074819 RepID=A0AAN6YTQ5_9PEZI|nr:hypothetical protein N656DRAFT_597833 [Canariomyces arenarius]